MRMWGMMLCILCMAWSGNAQKKIKWMTWDEAMEKSQAEQKKIVVDIYTKWCGWCKKMDKATFRNEFIVDFVNDNFYAVKFDAEYKDPIVFNGKEYNYVKKGRRGFHELAIELTKGKLSFPTVVFMDENRQVIQPIPGFQDAEKFELIMTYFAGEHFKETPWRRYTRIYNRENYLHMVGKKKN